MDIIEPSPINKDFSPLKTLTLITKMMYNHYWLASIISFNAEQSQIPYKSTILPSKRRTCHISLSGPRHSSKNAHIIPTCPFPRRHKCVRPEEAPEHLPKIPNSFVVATSSSSALSLPRRSKIRSLLVILRIILAIFRLFLLGLARFMSTRGSGRRIARCAVSIRGG